MNDARERMLYSPIYSDAVKLLIGKLLVPVVCHLVMYHKKGTYMPYNGTFGAPDQGQMLDL
jgi:hypothetical protein